MRWMTAHCWASFWPNTATCGPTMLKSFVTTVQTPRKWTGREMPHMPLATLSSFTYVE